MNQLDLLKIKNPLRLIDWLVDSWGGPSITGRWNIRELRFIDFKNDSDFTFIILKWTNND